MKREYTSSEKSDVFHIKDGEIFPFMRDEEGNLYEAVTPSSDEDPFTFRPKTLEECIFGLGLVEGYISNNPTAKEMYLRSMKTLKQFVQGNEVGGLPTPRDPIGKYESY